jgi:WD40 repeat protein
MESRSDSDRTGFGTAAELVLQTGHAQPINSVTFSHDRRWLASASADNTIVIWDLASGLQFCTLAGHADSVTAVAFSPNDKLLASGCSDNNVKLWDFTAGKELFNLATGNHPMGISAVAFEPSGQKLISLNQDTTAITWDAASGQEIGRFCTLAQGASGSAYFTNLALDAHWVISDRIDRTVGRKAIELWDVTTAKLVFSRFTNELMNGGRISPDGGFLAYTDTHYGFGVWDIAKGRVVFSYPGKPSLSTQATLSCAFRPDSKVVAVQHPEEKSIRLMDVATGNILRTIAAGSSDYLQFSDDGRTLAAADGRNIGIIDVESGQVLRVLTGYTRSIGALSISGDGRFLSVQNQDDNSVNLWDLRIGRQVRSFVNSDGNVGAAAVALSGDGRLIAAQMPDSTGANRVIRICETATGREVASFAGTGNFITSLSFNPDGSMLAAGDYRGNMKVWDTQNDTELVSFADTGVLPPKCRVAFSADGLALAAVARNSVVIWSTEKRDWVNSIRAGYVLALEFSPDGKQIATVEPDPHSITIWNLESGGTEALTIPNEAEVTDLAFSPVARLLASSCKDHVIRLWDADSGKLVREFAGHGGEVCGVSFTPDGRWLISAGAEGSIRIWDLSSGTTIAILCSMGGTDEWVVVTPQGLFDGSPQGSKHLVAWRVGDRVLAASQFYNQYSTPGLLAQVLSERMLIPPLPLAVPGMPPSVSLIPPPGDRVVHQQRVQIAVEAKDEGGGVAQVRLYHNGKLAGARSPVPGSEMKYTFDIMLLPGQDNVLRAVALGNNRLESAPDAVILRYEAPPPPKPVLHILAVGINDYEDGALHLDYAQPDAQALANFFQMHGNLFRTVNVIPLLNQKATKAAIHDALEQLAQSANPEDVALLYFAGHGMLVGQQFYFLPGDMRKGADLESAVQTYGIPASALGDALLRVKAVKQLLILDACQSESALPSLARATFATRGLEKPEQRAVRMLAHAHGIYLIAASTAAQYAYEVPELGHGVFTYALLAGLGENGEPRALNPDGIVTVLSLINYVALAVPELTEKYHMGDPQTPVIFDAGTDIPLLSYVQASSRP